MIPVFVDTSGWAALLVRAEKEHANASRVYQALREQGRPLLTTNYVLVELIALFSSPMRLPRPIQFQYIDAIRASRILEIQHVDADLDAAGFALLKARSDKDWSLVDAVSFVIMQERGIRESLTTDHHFEQAGFTRLLTR